MKIEIDATKREAQGTGASRRLRRAGKVPGIVYGGEAQPIKIELDHKDLLKKLHTEAFHASILTLKLEGGAEQVLLRNFNMHPFKAEVQHVDFQRVSKDRKISMKVPLHFINAETSPGVKQQGGVASHVMNELNIACLPDDLPEYVEVDMGELAVGDSIHARDIKLPKGVEAVLHKGENPVVASILLPTLVAEEEAPVEEAAPAASEVPTSAQAAPEKAPEEAGADKAAEKKEKK